MTGIKKFKHDREEALQQQEKQRQERRCLANPSLTLREVHLSCLFCKAHASDHCREPPLSPAGRHLTWTAGSAALLGLPWLDPARMLQMRFGCKIRYRGLRHLAGSGVSGCTGSWEGMAVYKAAAAAGGWG